jgi:hypothetical protein
MRGIYLITFADKMTEINDKFNTWTDKLTSNSVVASFLTLGVFLLLCLFINNHANK